ncbi:hypothetical protein LJR039_004337 [Pseudorhodoferax sp. LjRoot39]|uniref:hypothetical protein n=1 Tax=Pseudorhodoferax sp. LjRoot39 TaxID=3342328 RepID=UPI003ECC24EB
MSYRNRALVREPLALIRGSSDEQEEMDFLIEEYGGVSRAEAYRLALLDMARMKRHARNSLSPSRIGQSLDKSSFGGLVAA